MKAQITGLLLILLSGATFAGPSISGGTSEAPWVRSHDVFKQVLKQIVDKNYSIHSMGFENDNVVLAQVSCRNGDISVIVFEVEDDCTSTGIPNLCIPTRVVKMITLDKNICSQF